MQTYQSNNLYEQERNAGCSYALRLYMNTTGELNDFNKYTFEERVERFLKQRVHQCSRAFVDGFSHQLSMIQKEITHSRELVSCHLTLMSNQCIICGRSNSSDTEHYDMHFRINAIKEKLTKANDTYNPIPKKHASVQSQQSVSKVTGAIIKIQNLPDLKKRTYDRLQTQFERYVSASNNHGIMPNRESKPQTIARGWFMPSKSWTSTKTPPACMGDMVQFGRLVLSNGNGLWASMFPNLATKYSDSCRNVFVSTGTVTHERYFTTDDAYTDVLCGVCGGEIQIVKFSAKNKASHPHCVSFDTMQNTTDDDFYLKDVCLQGDYFVHKNCFELSKKRKST